jgi:hypothetical protein
MSRSDCAGGELDGDRATPGNSTSTASSLTGLDAGFVFATRWRRLMATWFFSDEELVRLPTLLAESSLTSAS